MPSLADIANDVNNKLSQIESNTSDASDTAALIKSDTADIKGRLDTVITGLASLESTNASGFSLVEHGLFAILESVKQSNALLQTQIAQGDAILCWLTKIANLLCEQLREFEKSNSIGTEVIQTVQTLGGILELVHAREFVEHQRKLELEARLEECCPPPEGKPEPCFEPCPRPKLTEYKPLGQDWVPERKHFATNKPTDEEE